MLLREPEDAKNISKAKEKIRELGGRVE